MAVLDICNVNMVEKGPTRGPPHNPAAFTSAGVVILRSHSAMSPCSMRMYGQCTSEPVTDAYLSLVTKFIWKKKCLSRFKFGFGR